MRCVATQLNWRLTPITCLRCSLQAGSRTNSPSAQTSARPDPLEAPLLGAFTRGGVRIQIREALSPRLGLNAAMVLIAAYAHIHWAGGLNRLNLVFSQNQPVSPVNGDLQIKRHRLRRFSPIYETGRRRVLQFKNMQQVRVHRIRMRLVDEFLTRTKLPRPRNTASFAAYFHQPLRNPL